MVDIPEDKILTVIVLYEKEKKKRAGSRSHVDIQMYAIERSRNPP